jgi:hypothetical protein
VVDYLIWYRLPTDFHVDDKVDVLDVRRRWMVATVMEVEGEEVLVSYTGCSRKWDQWIGVKSERLAPYRTKTQELELGMEEESGTTADGEGEQDADVRAASDGE